MRKSHIIIVSIAIIFFFPACRMRMNISKQDFKSIDKNFSGTFSNLPFKSKGRNYSPTLLKIFEIYNATSDSVILRINIEGNLSLTFNDSLTNRTELFNGKFSKKGYYEIYVRRRSVEIPPVVPFIFSSHDIYRIRIALTKDDDLILDNMWIYGGNIFILGAGENGRRQNYFKPIQSDLQTKT